MSENQAKRNKVERITKQTYSRPQLKKLGSVAQLTLKIGSVSDGLGQGFGDGGSQ